MRPFHLPLLAPFSLVLALAASLPACLPPGDGSASPPVGEGGAEDHDVIARPPLPGDVAHLVGFDDEGALVVVRPGDAKVVARRELGAGTATDLVVDERRGRLLVLLEEEEEHARLVEVPWTGGALGAPRELADTAGRARIALIHAGVLVASDADGPRVRLLRDDHEPTRGRSLAAPRSWWSDEGLHQVHGLELPPGGEAIRFTLGVDGTGSASIVARQPLGARPDEARLVEVAPGDERLIALDHGSGVVTAAALRTDAAAGPPPGDGDAPRVVATGVARLEGAIGWPRVGDEDPRGCGRGPARALAIVTAERPSVVVATLDGAETVVVGLDAEPPSGTPYGRRDLAIVDGRLFVATRGGVTALRSGAGREGDGGRLEVDVDATFDGETLRGPLGCLAR